MKVLKIDNNQGFYFSEGEYKEIDKIDKEGLLKIVKLIVDDESVEIEEYNPELLKNQAHQVIYSNLFRKLSDLKSRRSGFIDESKRLFLDEYRRYSSGTILADEEKKDDKQLDEADTGIQEKYNSPTAMTDSEVNSEIKPEDLPF